MGLQERRGSVLLLNILQVLFKAGHFQMPEKVVCLSLLLLPSVPNRRWGLSSDDFGDSYHCFGSAVFDE